MSLAEFLHMGGKGYYVWSSFGMTAFCMVIELVSVIRRRRQAADRLRMLTEMEEG